MLGRYTNGPSGDKYITSACAVQHYFALLQTKTAVSRGLQRFLEAKEGFKLWFWHESKSRTNDFAIFDI